MKKEPEKRNPSDRIPAYAFARGVRGKYLDRLKDVPETSHESLQHIFAPLAEFEYTGSEFRLSADTWIEPGAPSEIENQEFLADFLSNDDRVLCRESRHWLHYVRPVHSELSASAGVNSVLLALWIVCPTSTHVPLRFQKTEAETSAFRLLDRFQWIPGFACNEVTIENLESAAELLSPIRECYTSGKRLRNALVLTFRGCVSVDWQSAFICFAAAVEALLTYSSGPGVTDRLARTYARLITTSTAEAEAAVADFKRLYALRSAIVHGRAHDRAASDQNLKDLADFSHTLRTLWRVVLTSERLRAQLELDDGGREKALSDS